jgi:hypothetical protein
MPTEKYNMGRKHRQPDGTWDYPMSSVTESIAALVRAESERGFSGFAGTAITATIPLSADLINAALRAVPLKAPVTGAALALQAGNRGVFLASLDLPLLKRIELPVSVEPTVRRSDGSLMLTIHLHPNFAVGTGLAVVRSRLTLPSFVSWDAMTLKIDLAAALRGRDAGAVLPLIRTLTVQTEPGRVVLSARILVEETP